MILICGSPCFYTIKTPIRSAARSAAIMNKMTTNQNKTLTRLFMV